VACRAAGGALKFQAAVLADRVLVFSPRLGHFCRTTIDRGDM
jgi:hypothetical protein